MARHSRTGHHHQVHGRKSHHAGTTKHGRHSGMHGRKLLSKQARHDVWKRKGQARGQP